MHNQKQKFSGLAKRLVLANANKTDDIFKRNEFPTLKDIAIEVVAKNFHLYPNLDGIPEYDQANIISKASTRLSIIYTAPYISQESYWRLACEDRWKNTTKQINIEDHGQSWKVAYLERHIEEFLSNLDIKEENDRKDAIKKELKAASSWIHKLQIINMIQSLDMEFITRLLPCLTSLTLTYGMKNSGMDYNRQSLGIKLSEAANLGEAIKNCSNLLELSLPANMIDDDLLRFIMAGININISLVELNLSHNKIGDQGARRIAKFLMRNEILVYLDLSNNMIGYDGSRYLAQALKINQTLSNLNLRLNSLNDKAGEKFFKDLMNNHTIIELNLSGNQLDKKTAVQIYEYLSDQLCVLKALYIGNNNFGEDSFDILKQAFSKSYLKLVKLDIRGCKFGKVDKQHPVFKYDYSLTLAERELTDCVQKHNCEKNENIPFIYEEQYLEKKEQIEKQKIVEEQNEAKKKEQKK